MALGGVWRDRCWFKFMMILEEFGCRWKDRRYDDSYTKQKGLRGVTKMYTCCNKISTGCNKFSQKGLQFVTKIRRVVTKILRVVTKNVYRMLKSTVVNITNNFNYIKDIKLT